MPGRRQEQRAIFPSIFTANLRGGNSDKCWAREIYLYLATDIKPQQLHLCRGWDQAMLCSHQQPKPNPTSPPVPRSKHPMTHTLPMYSQKNRAHSQVFVPAYTGVGTYSRGASKTCLTEKRPDGCQINSAPLLFAELTHYTWKAGCLSG